MKTASTQLITLLNGSTQFLMADLYTFTLQGGQVLRYTSADIDIVAGGNTFLASGPRFKRGTTRLALGVEVDTLDVTVFAGPNDTVNSQPFIAYAMRGGLDGATLTLERAFMGSWGDTSAGTLLLFAGRIADVAGSRTECRLKAKSDLELLNISMPRNLYQPSCILTVYDANCAANRTAMTVAGVVSSVASISRFGTGLTQLAGWFDQGVISFTSGANAGIQRTVKAFATDRSVSIALPFPAPVAIGDSFTIVPGCDKTQSTCQAKFNNLGRFRGAPYIPSPETAL